jgi:F-type H+-transporting ATPase subunit b
MNLVLSLASIGGDLAQQAKDVGEQFGFNPWLFLSQCVSFSIVCLLLYKFAYQPILTVLEARRQKIEQSLEDARKIKEQLAASERNHQEILAKANAEAQKLIEETRAAAKNLGDRLSQQAEADAEQTRSKATADAKLRYDQVMSDVRRDVARLVVDSTARILNKTLSDDDRRRLSEEAAREITAA